MSTSIYELEALPMNSAMIAGHNLSLTAVGLWMYLSGRERDEFSFDDIYWDLNNTKEKRLQKALDELVSAEIVRVVSKVGQ